MESTEEIDDGQHESEDENGKVTVKAGGVPRDIIEARARRYMESTLKHQQKRFVG